MPPSTSKSLRTATELTLIADIRPGFVATPDLMSYATRVGLLLRVLFELRKRSIEQQPSGYAGPLEKLRSLHFVRWSLLDGGRKLLLAVSFDRAWEPYIRGIVDEAGPFLDVIFCHCVGYEGHSTGDGYARFSEWVRERQVEVSFFYAGAPEVTADDQRYLRELEARLDDPAGLFRIALGDPGRDGIPPVTPSRPAVALSRLMRAAAALDLVRPYFPEADGAVFFDRAAFQLLEGLIPVEPAETMDAAIGRLPPALAETLTTMRSRLSGRVQIPPDTEMGLAGDLQGNVLTEYRGMTHGCLAFLRFDTKCAARAFLSHVRPHVTTDAQAALRPSRALNVSLTLGGLSTLGLTESEIAGFPHEFQQGMEARAGLLGDVDAEHPARWQLPMNDGQRVLFSSVDLVLSLQARLDRDDDVDHEWSSAHPLFGDLTELVRGAGVQLLHVEPLRRAQETRAFMPEHFGYDDNISQPIPSTRWSEPQLPGDRVALGELVLGYRDEHGEIYPGSEQGLLRHGSFLVLRKLEQHLEALEAFVEAHARLGRENLYAKLMGRTRDGTPLVGAQTRHGNDFDYQGDPLGEACPLSAHVRRTNPRTPPGLSVHGLPSRTPRIMRRGFPFGPIRREQEGRRGLLFMAYNASIADQFEVVQRWMNGGNSSGDLSTHADPIVSHALGRTVTVLNQGVPERLAKPSPFVTLRWGTYLFTPSLTALEALATRTEETDLEIRAREQQRAAAEGRAIIGNLELLTRLSGEEAGRTAWKMLLEDRGARDKRPKVWAAIRERGGALETPYGLLVGSATGVVDVLQDGESCSVRKYFHRMSESVGALYLGMDRCPVPHQGARSPEDEIFEEAVKQGTYDRHATAPNAYMRGITRRAAYQATRIAAELTLTALATPVHELLPHENPVVDLRKLAVGAVGAVSREWFGLPTAPETGVEFRQVFLVAAQSIFYPHPEPVVTEHARRVRGELETLEAAALASDPAMLPALSDFGDDEKKRALVGGAQGFVVATVTSFLSVAEQWLANGRAFRLAHWLKGEHARDLLSQAPSEAMLADDSLLVAEMLASLRRSPQPDILHRTAVRPKDLAGGALRAEPGDTVVVSLASAAADAPHAIDLLFGGGLDPSAPAPLHACPGKDAALGVMLGLWVTLLTRNELRGEGPFSVSFNP